MRDYPSDEDLEKISKWEVTRESSAAALFDFIEDIWNTDYGTFNRKGRTIKLVTGGWSGNESIISAINQQAWSNCWEESKRGGLHVFKIPKIRK